MTRRLSIFTLLLLLLLPMQGWAAQAIVQSKIDAATQPFVTDGIAELTFDGDFVAGNTVCVGFAFDASSRTVVSVIDDAIPTNTYTLAVTNEVGGTLESWGYCSIIANAANVVTVTVSAAVNATGVILGWEVNDSRATSSVGNVNSGVSSGTTSHTSNAVALTDAAAMMLGMSYGSTGVWTIDSDYTEIANRNVLTAGYRLVSAGDTMLNTTAGNEGGVTWLIEIRPAAAAGATTRNLMLLGVGQ